MAFESLFQDRTQSRTQPEPKNGLFGDLFDKKVVEPVIEKEEPRIVNLPEHLGGGEYKVGEPFELVKTPRSYAGLPTQEKQERDHIISVALGGTSNRENLQFLKSTDGERQEGKVSVEQLAINDYVDGKISLAEARAKVAQKQQQIQDLSPTEKEQTIAGQIIPATKDLFGDIWGGIKKVGSGVKDLFVDVEPIPDKVRFSDFFRETRALFKPTTEEVLQENLIEMKGTDGKKIGSTKFGEMVITDKEGNVESYFDPLGGVGEMRNIAKEGIEQMAKEFAERVAKGKVTKEMVKDSEKVIRQVQKMDVKPKAPGVQELSDIERDNVINAINKKGLVNFGLEWEDYKKYDKILDKVETFKDTRADIAELRRLANAHQILPENLEQIGKKLKQDIFQDQRGVAKVPDFIIRGAESIAPIRNQDEITQTVFRKWTRDLTRAEQKANTYVTKIPKVGDDFRTILNYEKGIKTKSSKVIKNEFDKLFDEAVEAGIDVPYRKNYIPQLYDNTTKEVQEAMSRYMKDKGVAQETIDIYLDGIDEIPNEISTRLKINPRFMKERAFPNYDTAMKYDLTPKYTEPGELLANYRLELDKTIANKKFLEDLQKEGKVTTIEMAGPGFEPVSIPFSPKGFYAKPNLAKMLNGMYRNEEMLGLTETLFKTGATLSKTMQEIVLSAGIPKTDINFFTIGQLVKNLTAGEGKAAVAFIRANFNKASIKYFRDNVEYLNKMANQGIDIAKNVSRYDEIHKKIGNIDGIGKKLGFVWDKAFGEKTFKSFMPQIQTATFKNTYDSAIKQGMKATDAEKLAGDTTKAFYGLYESVGRSKRTDDIMSSVLFAPKFREGIVRTLFNTGKSLTTEIFNPAFKKNRKLVGGMILAYGGYNALNKKLTGHNMWENPPGKEFDLMIPTDKGTGEDDIVYVPFMPSFLAFARNMASGVIATGKGDLDTAKQKFGSLFSMPVKLASELWANQDFFGREIYNEDDTKKQQMKDMAGYVFGFNSKEAQGGINHPFIRETYNQIATDKPLYQSLSEAMEMPMKFGTMSGVKKQQLIQLSQEKQKEAKRKKDEFKPRYDEVKTLLEQGDIEEATRKTQAMTEDEYKIYKSLKRSDKARANLNMETEVFDEYKEVMRLLEAGDDEGAIAITEAMTPDEYSAYKRLKSKLK